MMIDFRAILLERCNEIGMTQTELATASGICRQTINEIMRGKKVDMRVTTLETLMTAVGVDFVVVKEGGVT